jgi:hypothetical protein
MYTVAEQVPMMADVRQGISSIPLSMLVYEKNRQSQMTLAFYLSQNWNKEVYLLDSITGARTRILNGLMLTVPMPDNHQLRYYIEGPDEYIGSNANQDNTPTGIEQENASHTQMAAWTHSPARGILHIWANQPMQSIQVYDLVGREIMVQSLDATQHTVNHLPSGIYIVGIHTQDGQSIHLQTTVL